MKWSGRWRLVVALAIGLGILWLMVVPDPAVATTGSPGLPGSLTATTEFKLGQEAQTQVSTLTARVQEAEAEIATMRDQLGQKIDEYYRCLEDLEAATSRLAELRRQVSDAQAKKAKAQAVLAQRLKAVYKSGGRDQLLEMLLLSSGLQDFYNRVRLVATLADQDRRIVSDLQTSATRLDLLMKATDGERRNELALRARLSREAATIQKTKAQKQQIVAGLDAEVKAVIERERQRQLAEQARLQAEMEARLQAEMEARLLAMQNPLVAEGRIRPRGSNILQPEQIALVAQEAGFSGRNLVLAVAVALAESGGNANAVGDTTIGGSFGLWQVYCMAHPTLIPPADPDSVAWYDPYQNARWAYQISRGSNWSPWSTYKHGTYLAFMDAAQDAVVSLISG